MQLLENELDIDIDEIADTSFDLEQSVAESKKFYEENKSKWLQGTFDDDVWKIAKTNFPNLSNELDFTILNPTPFNKHLPIYFKDIVKCWIIYLLDKYNVIHAQLFFNFLKIYELTHGFKKEKIEDIIELLKNSGYSDKTIYRYAVSVINFIDYSENKDVMEYLQPLTDLKNGVNWHLGKRILPSSKTIFKFSQLLEKHFEKLLTTNSTEILLFYPIVIWWKLTNIIPMRPIEFCLLDRDCAFIKDGKHYINIGRRKQRKQSSRGIQIPDDINISEEMYDLIKNYINLTYKYGKSLTLISPKSINTYNGIYLGPGRNDDEMYNVGNLGNDILRVCGILEKEYNTKIIEDINICGVTSRYLAIINMMFQGYSPLEIARMAGHQHIQVQYTYSNHIEFWADCEVLKLTNKIKQSKLNTRNTIIPEQIKSIALKSIFDKDFKKLKIGYCKDKSMTCESDSCYFCSHWGISLEELQEKHKLIAEEIGKLKNNIADLKSSLINIHKQYVNDAVLQDNVEILNRMTVTTNKMNQEIKKLANLYSNISIEGELFE